MAPWLIDVFIAQFKEAYDRPVRRLLFTYVKPFKLYNYPQQIECREAITNMAPWLIDVFIAQF
jgi:hypothetical protein